MRKIPLVTKTYKTLKKGDVRLAHAPNGSLCWVSKNLVNDILWFPIALKIPKTVERFANSSTYRN